MIAPKKSLSLFRLCEGFVRSKAILNGEFSKSVMLKSISSGNLKPFGGLSRAVFGFVSSANNAIKVEGFNSLELESTSSQRTKCLLGGLVGNDETLDGG